MKKLLYELGFDSIGDFFQSSFAIKGSTMVAIQVFGVVVATGLTFIRDWIYEPPEAPVLLACMIAIDTALGIAKAYNTGADLDVRRLSRQALVTVAHMGVLALCSWLKKVEPTLFFLPNSAFIWFALRSLFSILRNLVQLKLISNDFVLHLTSKIAGNFDELNSKQADKPKGLGSPLVHNMSDESALN